MLKKFSSTTKLFGGLIVIVLVVLIIMISVAGNKVTSQAPTKYVTDSASADNKVEALKTVTADLLTVQDKNAQLEKMINDLKSQNQQTAQQLQQSISQQMQQALQEMANQNQSKQDKEKQEQEKKESQEQLSTEYGVSNHVNGLTWISDLSKSNSLGNNIPISKDANFVSIKNEEAGTDNTVKSKKPIVKPIYTIPVNATLTGAVLMTPLVGRIPIDDKLTSPYLFKLVLSAENLTANGYPLPGVKGAVMSGVASGDMLGSCVRGDIHSITFIFNDGAISTTEVKGDNESLAYISGQMGNPCIPGAFHSNAAIFLGAQMGLAGAEGYANAIESSQYMNAVTPEGGNISTLVGNANKAGLARGMSSAAVAAQNWWNQRVRNSFDYIYVPNVDTTGKPMRIVVNITQQIPIDYNTEARKVSYEETQNFNNQLD